MVISDQFWSFYLFSGHFGCVLDGSGLGLIYTCSIYYYINIRGVNWFFGSDKLTIMLIG